MAIIWISCSNRTPSVFVSPRSFENVGISTDSRTLINTAFTYKSFAYSRIRPTAPNHYATYTVFNSRYQTLCIQFFVYSATHKRHTAYTKKKYIKMYKYRQIKILLAMQFHVWLVCPHDIWPSFFIVTLIFYGIHTEPFCRYRRVRVSFCLYSFSNHHSEVFSGRFE